MQRRKWFSLWRFAPMGKLRLALLVLLLGALSLMPAGRVAAQLIPPPTGGDTPIGLPLSSPFPPEGLSYPADIRVLDEPRTVYSPEPGSVVLLGMGMSWLLLMAWRRRNRIVD